jgi:hypothetical protein
VHTHPVVGEHPDRRGGRGHGTQLSESLAAHPGGDRTDGVHIDQPDLAPAPVHVFGHHRGVGHRIGIGHREHRGVAAQRCGGRTGGDRLGIFPAGLAQVDVQVHQAWQRHQPATIDHLGARAVHSGTQLGDHPVSDQQVHRVTRAVGADSAQQQRPGHAWSCGD